MLLKFSNIIGFFSIDLKKFWRLKIRAVQETSSDKVKPKEYYYENRIVTVYKKYQCPKYCQTNHFHYVYYDSETNGMTINKSNLGKKIKKRKK